MDIFKDGLKKGSTILILLGGLITSIYETERRVGNVEKKLDSIMLIVSHIDTEVTDQNKFSLRVK